MTGRSIDWLRLEIGESGQIDKLGARTQRWTLRDGEREGESRNMSSVTFLFSLHHFQNERLKLHKDTMKIQSDWFQLFK